MNLSNIFMRSLDILCIISIFGGRADDLLVDIQRVYKHVLACKNIVLVKWSINSTSK
jgi:thiamine pyrophosphokinase